MYSGWVVNSADSAVLPDKYLKEVGRQKKKTESPPAATVHSC